MVKGHKLPMPKRYQHIARITAQATFPLDMLRYDNCHPCSEQDTRLISELLQKGGTAVVYVETYTPSPDPSWTTGKWESFMARCEPVTFDELVNRDEGRDPNLLVPDPDKE